MMLINTSTLEMAEFASAPRPSSPDAYAILSHRWGLDEVTFDEWKTASNHAFESALQGTLRKAGWSKISECCAFARNRGLRWAWIDTCCIDKRSSAELSEAINSMWDWYACSKECYVYMDDVPPLVAGHAAVMECFAESAWFTRAWTLQELIAPASIIFMNERWDVIGGFHKSLKSLANKDVDEYCRSHFTFAGDSPNFLDTQPDEIISAVITRTRIPRRYIATIGAHSEASVAQRMSWAAFREASRPEDTAYSLLGLFDINMPLLYGEKGVKAFRRLQKEIIAQSDDESVFVWKRRIPGFGQAMAGYTSREVPEQAILASSPDDFVPSGTVTRTAGSRPKPFRIINKWLKITTMKHESIAWPPGLSEWLGPAYFVPLNCEVVEDTSMDPRPCFLVLRCDPATKKFDRYAVNLHGHEVADLVKPGWISRTLTSKTQQFYASITDAQ